MNDKTRKQVIRRVAYTALPRVAYGWDFPEDEMDWKEDSGASKEAMMELRDFVGDMRDAGWTPKKLPRHFILEGSHDEGYATSGDILFKQGDTGLVISVYLRANLYEGGGEIDDWYIYCDVVRTSDDIEVETRGDRISDGTRELLDWLEKYQYKKGYLDPETGEPTGKRP